MYIYARTHIHTHLDGDGEIVDEREGGALDCHSYTAICMHHVALARICCVAHKHRRAVGWCSVVVVEVVGK